MQVTQIKEDISISYISALCAYAGIAYEIVRHDDDSTDGTLRKRIILDNAWSKEELLIKGCMYWAEFSGAAESMNSDTITIQIDKRNVVNAETLNQILEKIAREEWP